MGSGNGEMILWIYSRHCKADQEYVFEKLILERPEKAYEILKINGLLPEQQRRSEQ